MCIRDRYFLYHPYSTHFKFGESLYTCNIQYLLHCTERCVYNSGEARKYDKYSMSSSLKFFSAKWNKNCEIESIFACLFATIAAGGEKHSLTGWFHRPISPALWILPISVSKLPQSTRSQLSPFSLKQARCHTITPPYTSYTSIIYRPPSNQVTLLNVNTEQHFHLG